MKNEKPEYRGTLSLEEIQQIAQIDQQYLTQQNKRRPDYHIRAFLTTGNNVGEKRVFRVLEDLIDDNNVGEYLMAIEGYAGNTILKCMENFAPMTKDERYHLLFNRIVTSGRGWDVSDEGGLKDIIYLLFVMYKALEVQDVNEVVSAIDDREDKGLQPGDHMNKTMEDKGMCAFEAYALCNKKIRFFGLENGELLRIQRKLSHGDADEHFYKVAKVRSRVMFKNLIDLMDSEKRSKALVHCTGFHHLVFEELAKAHGISYEAEFVHNLPPYESGSHGGHQP